MRRLQSIRRGRENQEKGKKYEREFGEYLKSIGYEIIEYGEDLFGDISKHKHDCDIHAKIKSSEADLYKKKAWLSLFLTGILVIAAANSEPTSFLFTETVFWGQPSYVIASILLLGFTFYCMWKFEITKNKILNVWVECKNKSENIKRDDMIKFIGQVNEIRNSEIHAEWAPDKLIYASSSRYDIDAINYAREHNIDLFQGSGDSFKQIHYRKIDKHLYSQH